MTARLDRAAAAAALLRKRAKAATPGRWWPLAAEHEAETPVSLSRDGSDAWTLNVDHYPNREHVAALDPDVAIALADLLDFAATHQIGFTPLARERVDAVVSAYLRDAGSTEGDHR